ncbi:MAG: hypothetical protein HY675_28510 [Chloroflexi bacterium]|nr:hypothetical protein [Chloroflexota bacterium]
MRRKRVSPEDPRIKDAVSELQGAIAAHYPEATFEVGEGEDPAGVYLTAIVDTDDLTHILEIVEDRLVDIQVEQGVPLYFVPTRPITRVLDELRRPRPRRRLRIDLEETVPPGVR